VGLSLTGNRRVHKRQLLDSRPGPGPRG
jgi:hypothetical protein